jgi:hypothetical protein
MRGRPTDPTESANSKCGFGPSPATGPLDNRRPRPASALAPRPTLPPAPQSAPRCPGPGVSPAPHNPARCLVMSAHPLALMQSAEHANRGGQDTT